MTRSDQLLQEIRMFICFVHNFELYDTDAGGEFMALGLVLQWVYIKSMLLQAYALHSYRPPVPLLRATCSPLSVDASLRVAVYGNIQSLQSSSGYQESP